MPGPERAWSSSATATWSSTAGCSPGSASDSPSMGATSKRLGSRLPPRRAASERKPPSSSELDRLAALEPDDVLAELRSTKDGLTSADAAERLEQTGTNELVSS